MSNSALPGMSAHNWQCLCQRLLPTRACAICQPGLTELQHSSSLLSQSTWRSSRNEPHLQQFFRNNSFITYALLEHRNLPNSASSSGNGWAAGDSVAISGIVKLDQNQTAVAPGPETISHLLPGRWSSSPSQGGTGMYRMHGRRMRMCLINLFSFPAQNI